MEVTAADDPTPGGSDPVVGLTCQPSSTEETDQVDMAKTEPHRTSQVIDEHQSEDVRSSQEHLSEAASSLQEHLAKAARSSQEHLESVLPAFEGQPVDSPSCSEEKEPVTETQECRTSSGVPAFVCEETFTEGEGEALKLLDGTRLQSETDVDSVCVADLGGGEVVNKFHHLADLSSVSPSISTDKTITSSTMSSSSMDGDSLSIDPPDSSLSPSRMLVKSHVIPPPGPSCRTEPASSVTESVAAEADVSADTQELKEEERKQSVGADNVETYVPDDSASPQTEVVTPPPEVESSELGEVRDTNNHSLSNAHRLENGNSAPCGSTVEPFSSFTDSSRLCADLGQSGSGQSGNVQEQRLQTLVNSLEDPRCWKQLKKLLRSGSWAVQSTVRKVAWLQVCSHLHKLEKAFVYVQMEQELFGDMEDEDVPVPVWPQQPHHDDDHVLTEYYLTPKGKNTAHKILTVIGQLSPDISYCPGLLPLVDLFLHYMDAADCFSCVLTLLQSKGPVYLVQSRVAFEASKKVVKDLAKKYAKSAYVSLVRSCSNVESIFDNWMGWLYSDLPFNYVVVMTDSFLMEGIKVLYRVVLAILLLYTKHSGHTHRGATAPATVANSISHFCQNMPVPPAKLLKVAFRIRGFSRKKLLKLQNHHEGLIASGALNPRPDMPHISSKVSMENASTAVSMAHPNTKMMGFHDTGSNILTVDQLVTIWNWLPPRYAIFPPTMLFNSADLGTSLMTLYAHIELEPCTVIIIKTVEGQIFGAFCADPWVERKTYSRPVRFFGTGETFLFTITPERVKFEWVGKPDPHVPLSANMFQAGDNSSLLIGGGGGCGIQLDGMMERCRTETCDTFNNPPLCCSEDFVPAAVEVLGMSM